MRKINCSWHVTAIVTLMFWTMLLACNPRASENGSKESISTNSSATGIGNTVPDSVIQFLISSAATDFNDHQPTVRDIRNVRAGYIVSEAETIYLMCGEFLSEEKGEWHPFETIKTSGYEQYIGNVYCQKGNLCSG